MESAGHGVIVDEMLSRAQMSDEFLLMGLRLTDGIDPGRYRALRGRPLDDARVAALARDGFVDQDQDGTVRVTRAGFPVLDALIAQLAA